MASLIKHGLFSCLAVFPLGMLGAMEARAGNGYVDAQGKWHLSVAFIQPDSGKLIDEEAWLKVFRAADTLLYYSTNGKHQFGSLTLVPKRRYSSIVDIFIWRDEDRSLADVAGFNRPGYHIYMSDFLRDPGGYSVRALATVFVHELGHYLYSLYDEYRNPDEIFVLGSAQCIYPAHRHSTIDRLACFMESFDESAGAWCYVENHELETASIFQDKTWQSKGNNKESCWSTMRRLYPGIWNPDEPPKLPWEIPFNKFVPFEVIKLAAHSELVVAVDASIAPNSSADNVMLQILGHALLHHPEEGGSVVLLKYNRDSTLTTAPLSWDTTLAKSHQDVLKNLRLSDKPNAHFSTLLQSVSKAFNALAAARNSAGGAARTFLLISSGKENPQAPDSALTAALRAQNIRATIGFARSVDSLSSATVEAHRSLAAGIGGAVYDATVKSVVAYQAADAANKQIIEVKTAPVSSPGTYSKFDYTVQDSIREAMVSVSWLDPNCDLAVTILRNGIGEAVTASHKDDWVGYALKARRYHRLAKDEKLEVQVTVPAGCQTNPLPVTFSISDEQPRVFLTVAPERSVYGRQDNQVVHARAHAPYPLIGLDKLIGERVEAYGEFFSDSAQPLVDDGINMIRTKFFNGDWIKDDGIYSQIIKSAPTAGQLGRLLTIRFLVSNLGQARLAPGEKFSNADRVHPIPKFRRVAFATYFLDLARKTSQSLSLDLNPIKLLLSNPSKLNVTGNLKLTPAYPHIYAIRGKINNLDIKLDGTKVNVKDLKISLSDMLKLSKKVEVTLTALYRTGDSVEVKLNLPLPLLKDSNGGLHKEFWHDPSRSNPLGMATDNLFDIPSPREKPLTIDGMLRQYFSALLTDRAFAPSATMP
ncbi:MAG: hypothetical protein ACREOI_20665 [bacterium]